MFALSPALTRLFPVRPTNGRGPVRSLVLALLATPLAVGFAAPAQAVPSTGLMISEVYPGGGNAGATYNADFIELYNASGAPISLNNKSLQYRASGGSGVSGNVFALPNVSVPSHGYFLVKGAGGANGVDFPRAADAPSSLALGASAGQIYLADSATGINPGTGAAVDYSAGKVIDFLGYGTGTNTFETATKSGTITTAGSYKRAVPPTDADNNNTDFTISPVNAASGSGAGTGPDNCDCVAPPRLAITEVYTEGGTAGAAYDHDFVELQNVSGGSLSMAGLSLQYRAPGATGRATKVLNLSGTMANNSFDIVQLGTSGAEGAPVPFDAGYDVSASGPNLDSAGGTLFVAKNTDAAGYDPQTGDVTPIVDQFRGDLVGWGTSNTFETAPVDTALVSATTSFQRSNGGVDSGDNSADFGFYAASPNAQPAVPVKTIPEIQGTGATTPLNGANVSVTGIVTAAYPNSTGGFNGFYLQTPGYDPANDATPGASDGIFVFTGTMAASQTPAVGKKVTISSAKVSEFRGMTELTSTNGANLTVVDATPAEAVTPGAVVPGTGCALPGTACLTGAALEAAREAHEGELYRPTAPYTVSDSYDGSPWTQAAGESFKMKGEIGLAANDDKALMAPTEITNPTRDPQGLADRNAYNEAHTITLDDGTNVDYASTTGSAFPWLTSPTHTVRVGAPVTFTQPLVLDFRDSLWKLQPQAAVPAGGDGSAQGITIAQNRPLAPEAVGGNVRIATFNMLNYFPDDAQTWVSTGGDTTAPGTKGTDRTCTYYTDRNGVGGAGSPGRVTANTCTWTDDRTNPATTLSPGPRGAAQKCDCADLTSDYADFERQQAKEIRAINTMNADVMSLEEVENAIKLGYADRDRAVKHLIDVLNADWATRTGEDTVADPRWAYAPTPKLEAQPTILEQDAIRSAFIYNPRVVEPVGRSEILVNSAPFRNAREPLAQAFKRVGGNRNDGFIVIVNHFKSKGDSSGTASGDNVDKGDGAGSYNGDRVRQAKALDAFAKAVSDDKGIPAVFLTGDYNAYSHEDPILTLDDAGWHELAPDNHEKTYTFGGLMGTLDHVFANDAAQAMVTGQTVWPINANEPVFYEYSRFNYNVTDLYDGTAPYRASDHNPEVIGINAPLNPPPADVDTVQVLASNDFHGRILDDPASAAAGAAAMASAVKGLRTANPSTVFAMAGDIIGASTFESFIQDDKPTLDAMNAAGLDVSSAGNHEFDRGYSDLKNRVMAPYDATTNPRGGANWPYLAANVRLKSDSSYALASSRTDHGYDHSNGASWWKTLDDGHTVGFVGAVTEDLPSLVAPSAIADVKITSIVNEVNTEATRLKTDGCGGSPCDLVIELVHEGNATPDCSTVADPTTTFGRIVSGANADVDAIVSGHTHLKYNCKVTVPGWSTRAVTKRPVVSAGQYGSYLNQLEFDFTQGTDNLVDVRQHVLAMKDYDDDAATKSVVDAAVAYANTAGQQVLGQVTGPFQRARRNDPATSTVVENRGGESTLGNLVAEIQRWKTGAQIGFMNPGGLRADLLGSSATYPAEVTYRQAADVQPFANTLMTLDLTGAQLKTLLEQQWQRDPDGNIPSRPFLRLGTSQGFQFSYDPARAEGDRITGMWLGGTAIAPGTTYKVSASNFLVSGGDNFRAFVNGTNKQDTGFTDLQATVDYLAAHNPAAPQFAQHAVGLAPVNPPNGGYAPGDNVTLDVTSLAMTGDQVVADLQDGTVRVFDGATPLGTAATVDNGRRSLPDDEAGHATVSFTIPAGATPGTQRYVLRGTTTGTSFPITLQVRDNRVSSTVAATAADIAYGQAGSVAVTVTPSSATGQVEVLEGGTSLGTATLSNGTAAVALAARSLEVGAHTLTVTYAGDGATTPSQSTVSVTVVKATPTVTATANPSSVLQGSGTSSIEVSVNATGYTPTGTVEAWDGATKLGEAALSSGTAAITVGPFANAGSKSIEVRYLGDAHAIATSNSTTVTVTAPVTTTTSGTASNVTYGRTGSVAVTVTPAAATGSVEVLDGATSLGTATLADGTATVPLAAKSLEVGTHTLTVRYLGATGYATSSGTVDLTVLKAAPAVTATGSSVQTGDPATVAVTVTADGFTPTGTVEAWFNNNRVGQATLASGAATIPVGSFASAGAKSIEVRYLGDGHAAAATGATTVTVTDRPLTQTSVTGSAPTVVFGKAGSATITVMPAAATGTVELLDGATSLGTGSLSSGSATIALAAKSLSVGMHTLVARYAGNATYAASQGSFVVTVTKATPTVTATATPTTVKVKKDTTSVAVAVKADGVVPTGTVDVLVDGVVAATGTLVDGKATVVVGPFDAVGSRSLAVRYDGDASVAGATSGAVTVTVQKQQPRLTIGKPAGVRAGHVARIVVRVGTDGYAPHGKVRLQGHGLKARTVRVRAGKAVFGVRLDAGRHRLKAVFLGDGLSVKVVRTFHVRAR